ncbi:hypothetical protein PT974_08350 [Cladobotryum mycophilum]|uniref:TM7S3/TM198-like domain-containing protein n=1 Tax=Cladobotryum mycophilum TaxID=491253 RepID=A0ABR0SD58_9HYPO
MFSKTTRIWALLCLFLALQLAAAQSFHAVRLRDDNSIAATPSPTSVPEPVPTPTGKADGNNGDGKNDKQTGTNTKPPVTTTFTTSAIPTTTVYQTTINNGTYSTIPEGELPLKPRITPGWGVAGIVMIMTGLVYTLVGIKNRWIHSFFSTAYITSLGVAVLIVYVMNVPVSDAVQGGYVVAIILAGCALGVGSMFFKELTEGLGCALGGFCIGMWLLCLVPGGLLTAAAAKAIFIAAFTLVGFAFYFSQWTRDWAMIVLIAFGGATVVVLGLDCYSRSGLKEFWAYVWNLNDQLFPLGANTYPVTKGIRVETALVIIICLVGIISQIKLWRIVRDQREKKAAERAEGQRDLEAEEANVGRQIEEQTARERAEWERVYGDGTIASATASRFSDVGDIHSEKRLRSSHCPSTYAHSRADGIEMADMSDSNNSRVGVDGLMSAEAAKEGKITVRVASDDVGEDGEEILDEKAAESKAEGKRVSRNSTRNSKRTSRTDSKRGSRQQTVSPPPEVVPLPFTVPEDEEDTKSQGDRSSVATFADEDIVPPSRHRHSLVKRLSRNSVEMLRSFSQRSKQPDTHDRQLASGESSEELVEGNPFVIEDDRSSLAATVDDESVSGADRNSIVSVDKRKSIEITAELGKAEKKASHKSKNSTNAAVKEKETAPTQKEKSNTDKEKNTDTEKEKTTKSLKEKKSKSVLEKVKAFESVDTTKTAEVSKKTEEVEAEAKEAVDDKKTTAADASAPTEEESTPKDTEEAAAVATEKTPEEPAKEPAQEETPEPEQKRKSKAGPVTLTKDQLPKSLSKVALSYRTNEWAKHLSLADAPEPDEIHVEPMVESTKVTKEVARSVDVEDLQKTADEGALPPAAIKRSDSQLSHLSTARSTSRLNGKKDIPANLVLTGHASMDNNNTPTRSPISPQVSLNPVRSSSQILRRTSAGFEPIAEEHDAPAFSPAIPEENEEPTSGTMSPMTHQSETLPRPPVPGVVSYASPQTLLGQRETLLRNKSQGNLVSTSPEPTHAEAFGAGGSDAGSLFNYPMYAAAFSSDPDDVPLSARKEMMRQSSMMSLTPQQQSALQRSNSGVDASAESTQFNSHQPKRMSSVPTTAAREARLANFRQSVAQDLRTATPGIPSANQTPYASTSNLLNGVEVQRNHLINQKEAEAQRREMQRREKEWQDAMFDSRMRSGDLIDAHREVMRRMQNAAKE